MLTRKMLAQNGYRYPIESPDLKLYHSRLTCPPLFVAGAIGTDPANINENFAWELPTTQLFSILDFGVENRVTWNHRPIAPKILQKCWPRSDFSQPQHRPDPGHDGNGGGKFGPGQWRDNVVVKPSWGQFWNPQPSVNGVNHVNNSHPSPQRSMSASQPNFSGYQLTPRDQVNIDDKVVSCCIPRPVLNAAVGRGENFLSINKAARNKLFKRRRLNFSRKQAAP